MNTVIFIYSILLTLTAHAEPGCGYVASPLGHVEASDQLRAVAGIYHDEGFEPYTRDGVQRFARFEVRVDESGVTLGRSIYPSLFGPPESFEVTNAFTVVRARVSAPLAELEGKFLVEKEDHDTFGPVCSTYALLVRGNELFLSSFHQVNYVNRGPFAEDFRAMRRLRKD